MHYANEWPLLVVCPTSMSLTWCEELERWCPFLAPGDVNLVRSHHNAELRRARVTVLTYGLVTNGKERDRLLQNIASAGFRVVIADEAHYLKSKDAQRSKLLLPVLAAARRCIVLTGTPALNESQPNPSPNFQPGPELGPELGPDPGANPNPNLTLSGSNRNPTAIPTQAHRHSADRSSYTRCYSASAPPSQLGARTRPSPSATATPNLSSLAARAAST